MDVQFQKSAISCLKPVLREVRNTEQTQELRLSDGMPDISRVLAAWGQVILRGKEWDRDNIQLSAGIQIWVLYQPEGEEKARTMECWIPFQMKWDLPEDTPEGCIRIHSLIRFLDARNPSARKILVRAGIAALAEVYAPMTAEISLPDALPEDVELLKTAYPVSLPVEAGEKAFHLEEELVLPPSAPLPDKLLSYRMEPVIQDRKVLGNRILFRGTGKLHLLFESEEGQLHSWDFELPFSQYEDLSQGRSAEAQADVLPAVTALEMELDGEGHFLVKAGVTAQYLVCDQSRVEVVADAYSPRREVLLQSEPLVLPAILETRKESLQTEQRISADGNLVVDAELFRDYPRQQRRESDREWTMPAAIQILCYDGAGKLQSFRHKWDFSCVMKADPDVDMAALPLSPGEPQIHLTGDQMLVKAEQPLSLTTTGGQGLSMVTAMELGELRERDPEAPGLILRRAGHTGLWNIAKSAGSTMEAIRKANGLQEDPAPDRMLLIPVS